MMVLGGYLSIRLTDSMHTCHLAATLQYKWAIDRPAELDMDNLELIQGGLPVTELGFGLVDSKGTARLVV